MNIDLCYSEVYYNEACSIEVILRLYSSTHTKILQIPIIIAMVTRVIVRCVIVRHVILSLRLYCITHPETLLIPVIIPLAGSSSLP